MKLPWSNHPGEPADLDLVLRTHRGHEASARLLWDRHAPRLIALATALCRGRGGEATAHDLVQGAFCAILQTPRAELREIRDVAAYLARAVRNAALNEARRVERHDQRIRAAAPSARGAPGPVGLSDLPEDLRAALEQLEPQEQELIVLKHAAGLTFDQMATALDQNRSTLAGRYSAAMTRLRELLGASVVQGRAP